MKLALSLTDQSFTATKSVGIFNVSMGLARGFMRCPEVSELHILGNEECAGAFRDCPPHVRLHLLDRPVPRRFARVLWDQWGVSRALRRLAPDWALLPKGFPPFFPRLGRTKLACYVHDVNWEYYETERGGGRGENPFPPHELAYFRRLGLRALAVSDLVLTSTRFNMARFAAHVPGVRAAAVGIGFDSPLLEPAAHPGQDVLFYASPYPHKLTRLGISRLRAWLAAREGPGSPRIHLIGKLPEGCELPGEGWVRHGRLPQAELHALMTRHCRVSVYFSDYEGYGMPPVESLRAGLPCVASDLPPIRENIPARYLFDNADEASFIRVMEAAYQGRGGLERPDYPDWPEVARRAVRAMQERS